MQNVRVNVTDAPNHVLRLYDVRRSFTRQPPVFDGTPAVEMWEQGVSDTVDQNGTETAYITYVLSSGDKVFGRYAGTVQSFRWPDGTRHYDHVGIITLSGGTGALSRVRGAVRVRAAVDPGADGNQIESKGEYWLAQ